MKASAGRGEREVGGLLKWGLKIAFLGVDGFLVLGMLFKRLKTLFFTH